MRCASFGVTFGTEASSATEAVRTRRAEPRDFRRFVRIDGPTHGIWSELLVVGDREAVRLVPDPLERLERR
jgi:hypothetical protein